MNKTLEDKAREALSIEMSKGIDDNDPYWKLFTVKDQVNDAIVEAYKMGFIVSYKERDSEVQELKDAVLEMSKLLDYAGDIHARGCNTEDFEDESTCDCHVKRINRFKFNNHAPLIEKLKKEREG